MGSLASINIKFFADLKDFSSQMQNAERQMQKMGKSLENVGANMSMYVTAPILAMGAASLIAWDQSEKAIAQVNAGLKSTGGLVGYTTEQLQKMAAELQNNSLFDDDAILKDVTAQLLTFTNIAQEQFARTQKAALDLATRLDGDLKGASIQLGKALNDPIANLSALSRSGIQFSEDQKAMIKSLVETNRLADAQTVILDELERQYGGSAKAASEAGTGPLTQLGNILGNLSEDFGKMIGEAIMPFIAHLKEMALKLQALEPETKKVIAVVAILAATIGPLLGVLGVLMTTVIPAVIVGFGALKVVVLSLAGAIQSLTAFMLMNPMALMAAAVAALTYSFTASVQEITPLVSKFQTLLNLIKSGGVYTDFISLQMRDQLTAVAEQNVQQAEIKKAKEAQLAIQNQINEAINKYTNGLSIVVAKEKELVQVKQASVSGIQGAKKYEFNYEKDNAYNVTDFASAGSVIGGLNTKPLEEFKQVVNDMSVSVSVDIESMAASVANGFGEMLGNILSGTASFSDIGKFLLTSIGEIAIQLGKAAIQIGVTMQAIKMSFKNPFTAIAAGVLMIAVGTMMKNAASITKGDSGSKTRAFASGGIVYGPTMGLVGEYAGASSNPEVIAPLDKLKELIKPASSNNNITIDGKWRVSGNELQLVLDRASQRKNRIG